MDNMCDKCKKKGKRRKNCPACKLIETKKIEKKVEALKNRAKNRLG